MNYKKRRKKRKWKRSKQGRERGTCRRGLEWVRRCLFLLWRKRSRIWKRKQNAKQGASSSSIQPINDETPRTTPWFGLNVRWLGRRRSHRRIVVVRAIEFNTILRKMKTGKVANKDTTRFRSLLDSRSRNE